MKDEFIKRYALHLDKYSAIRQDFNLDREMFYKKVTEYSSEIEIARKVRQLCIRKNIAKENYDAFYNWYKKTPRNCHYCNTSEKDLDYYFNNIDTINKRPTRGKTLEIERIDPLKTDYGDINNLALSCYICNNAKSDFFTETQFKPIGLEIGKTIHNVIMKKRNG